MFNLREGVMFHNGEMLTADDVKFTYERILEEGTGSFIRGGILNISEINVVDDRRLLSSSSKIPRVAF